MVEPTPLRPEMAEKPEQRSRTLGRDSHVYVVHDAECFMACATNAAAAVNMAIDLCVPRDLLLPDEVSRLRDNKVDQLQRMGVALVGRSDLPRTRPDQNVSIRRILTNTMKGRKY